MIKIEKVTNICCCNCCQNANYKNFASLFNYVVQDIYAITFNIEPNNGGIRVYLCRDCLKQLAENTKIKLEELGV